MASRPVMAFSGLTMLVGVGMGLWWDDWSTPTLNAGPVEGVRSGVVNLDSPAQGLEVGGRQLSRIAKKLTPSVVHIQSQRTTRRGRVEETGSGAVIKSQARTGLYVVTNRHVVEGAALNDISIQLADGREFSPRKVWKDKETDLAVLLLPVQDVPTASWGDSDTLDIGHFVVAMGSPFGLSRSVTLGIISAKGRRSLSLGDKSEVLNQNFLQTDAAINPGNSGGPLVDLNGKVIGINTAIASNSGGNDGIGFSIPSNLARRVAEQLIRYGRVRRAYLGVKLDPEFNTKTASRLGLDRLRGARVMEVYPNTPAARARLRVNDVILKFNGRKVEDENDLINQVSLAPVGSRIEMEVVRSGRKQRMTVLLADRTELGKRDQPAEPRLSERIKARPMTLAFESLGDELLGK